MEEAKKEGRPSKYNPENNDIVYKFCLLGAIDTDIANLLNVDIATIYRWKNQYPEFREVLKRGKEVADAEVANALFNRAKGYSHEEEKVFCSEGGIVTHKTIKHYPPDTAAAFIWLKNRAPDRWSDKQKIEHSGMDFTINIKKAE